MEQNPASNLKKIFKSFDPTTKKVGMRENSVVELKETFNWAAKSEYAKSMAAFSNNRGGYLIFGVTNSPRTVVGLRTDNFENKDEANITEYLNSVLSPEIRYEKGVIDIGGLKIGYIYTHENEAKPVIAIKNDGDIHEAEIYYRYSARNDKIKYPGLKALFDNIREQEKKAWMDLFQRVTKIGPVNTAVMDMVHGKIEGNKGSVLIDSKLISKLKFIKEGQFSETGKPALKLIGDVRPVTVAGYKPGSGALRITDDPSALAVREETILKEFPLTYQTLVDILRKRYKNFVTNPRFHSIRKPLVNHPKYCKTRYLDPINKKGGKKDYYSKKIIAEFDKHYKKKN